jgi:circadian clock protein KaiB
VCSTDPLWIRTPLGRAREQRSAARVKEVHAVRRCANRAPREEAYLSKYLLKLYVTGTSTLTNMAIANLRRICEQDLEGRYELEIIDVLEFPQIAEDEKILATPTLIKQLPLPSRRVVGDLSDKDKVLLGLEMRPRLGTDNRGDDGS